MFLSILVSVYNEYGSVEKCLKSILNQSFKDFEVIVIDDGSYDKSGAVCDKYRLKDSRVKVIHKANQGLVAARKTALEMSCGEYVGFVDSDDYIDEKMFERLCGAAKSNDADMVICGSVHHRGDEEEYHQGAKSFGVFDRKRLEDEIYPTMLSDGEFFGFGVTPSLWNKLFRRDIIQCYFNVDNDTVMGEDAAAVYPCLLKSNRVVILENEFLYHYVVSGKSMTGSYKKWFFGSNRCVYRTLKKAKGPKCYERQLDDYILYSSVNALENEFSPANTRSFTEKLAGTVMYLISDDVNKAFCSIENRRLPLYVRLMGRMVRKKRYLLLVMLVKALVFSVKIKSRRK